MGKVFRYFIHLSFDGSKYHGWQIQVNALSVQETLNHALSVLLKESVNVVGCGRTDTGVHARNFYAHINIKQEIQDPAQLVYKLNKFLPEDIAIHAVFSVEDDFHARFSAIARTYQYFLHQVKNPFLKQYSYFYPFPLDIDKMNEAASLLFKYSDFTSFSKLHTDTKTNICHLYEAKWGKNENQLIFTISADRFLRNMVRSIVGTLLDIGRGKTGLNDMIRIIEQKNRSEAGISVPAHALFLHEVKYNTFP